MEATYDFKKERGLALWLLIISFVALAIGGLLGTFQALEHANINLYEYLPVVKDYYQGLTLHGVLSALTWTTFFIAGFQLIVLTRALNRGSKAIAAAWIGFVVMLAGVGMAGYAMLTGQGSVLYTFYLPMKAPSAFYYIGLTTVVVGTWLFSVNLFATWRAWRKENPGVKTPIAAVGVLTTWIVWDIATIGVAIEMLLLAIPWSLGIVTETNPLLARTLFWYFGHPLVYFWLLPAYTSWYALIPKQAGGKLFSDSLARLAFMLFILFSVPVGLHHQYTDPGISTAWKGIHATLTYMVAFPSFITAFTLMASLEYSGKQRGGKGLVRWIFKLPWGEPSFAAQVLAMLLFAAAGVSGVINASYNLNLVVHNTTWVVGHFHLTVGTATTLTFMGITYWLLPYISKRRLFSKRMALAQAWTWFLGMILFGRGMHWAGLLGAPRRVPFSLATYTDALIARSADGMFGGFSTAMMMTALGGIVLTVSGLLYFIVVIGSLMTKKESDSEVDVPLAEAVSGPERTPAVLDNWRLWVSTAFLLVLLSYIPVILGVLQASDWNAPGLLIR